MNFIQAAWDLIYRNKTIVGVVLQGMTQSLFLDHNIQVWLMSHPMQAAWIISLNNGLILAGVLRSDKEVKIAQILRKAQEEDTQ